MACKVIDLVLLLVIAACWGLGAARLICTNGQLKCLSSQGKFKFSLMWVLIKFDLNITYIDAEDAEAELFLSCTGSDYSIRFDISSVEHPIVGITLGLICSHQTCVSWQEDLIIFLVIIMELA